MASERDLQALEENDDELLALQTRMRVEGYRYEPRRTQSPVLSDDSSTDGSDSDDSDVETGQQRRQQRLLQRLGNTDWCTCGECVPMDDINMCLCCHEPDMVNYRREELDLQCITKHPGFVGNCINEYVLETSFWEYLADYGHVGDDEPVHEMYRHVAYRRFTRWIWQLLGKGVRKPIPSCAIHKIREKWPAQQYTGFQYRRT